MQQFYIYSGYITMMCKLQVMSPSIAKCVGEVRSEVRSDIREHTAKYLSDVISHVHT